MIGTPASGRPFLRQTDLCWKNIRLVADATHLPFAAGSLRAIVMTDVLHHIPNVAAFFSEASRCLRPGGAIAMIEPWNSLWSRFIYQNLHHEPFDPQSADWTFPATGPLSSSNGALPWIVFERDRNRFESEFPNLRLRSIKPMMPLRFLLSGGVSMKSFMPSQATPIWRAIERSLEPAINHLAMFAFIEIGKEAEKGSGPPE